LLGDCGEFSWLLLLFRALLSAVDELLIAALTFEMLVLLSYRYCGITFSNLLRGVILDNAELGDLLFLEACLTPLPLLIVRGLILSFG